MKVKLKDITFANIKHYLTGNIRSLIFTNLLKDIDFDNLTDWEESSTIKHLTHIQEQFLYRIWLVKNKSIECLELKHCKLCGCDTPELFFANKTCKGNCYPAFMSLHEWEQFKKTNNVNMINIFLETKSYLKWKKQN